MVRFGDALIDPDEISSAQVVEKKDWLGITEGYIIECTLMNGRTVNIKSRTGGLLCYLEAQFIMDDIEDEKEVTNVFTCRRSIQMY